MVGGGQYSFAPLLYKELIKRPEHQTCEQRQGLMRRIRETMVKLVPIVGVCKPLDAIFCIDEVTAPEDKDYSFSRYENNAVAAAAAAAAAAVAIFLTYTSSQRLAN